MMQLVSYVKKKFKMTFKPTFKRESERRLAVRNKNQK